MGGGGGDVNEIRFSRESCSLTLSDSGGWTKSAEEKEEAAIYNWRMGGRQEKEKKRKEKKKADD